MTTHTASTTPTPILPETPAWRITYAEIAALAQVKRPVPTTWARRHPDFPAPVAHDDGRPLFDARAVVDWLASTGRGNTDPRRLRAELALHTLAAWRTPLLPASVLIGALTSLVCLHQQLDAPVADGRPWPSLLERAAAIDPDDDVLVSELRALPDPDRTGPALAHLADELIDAAYNPAEAFDWILQARHRLGSREPAADEPTPEVTRALAALSGVDTLGEGSVIAVPYAGSGDLPAALHDRAAEDSAHTYLAADPDLARVRLVRRRMLVRGVYEFRLDVVQGEEVSVDEWGDPDLLVCALPYEPAETRDPKAVLEQVAALTDYLDTGAGALVLGPADALTGPLARHGDADRLRRSFLAPGLLKAAISLPDGAYAYRPGYRTAAWLLARVPEEQRTGLVLLADYSAQPLTEPVLATLAEDIAIWRTSGWRHDPRHEPRHAAIVRGTDLDDRPGAPFTPQQRTRTARYTRTVAERPARIADLERHLADLHARSAATGLHLNARAEPRPESRPVRRTSVARLLRTRRLRRRPGHRFAPEHLTADGHYPVLTPEEILGTARIGTRRIDRGILLTAYEHAQFTEPGDLVVTAHPRFGVHVDTAGLSLVAAPARILRVHPDADPPLRPRVLAALLRAAAAEHARVGGAVRAPRRIEDLVIPDLGRAEADLYEAVLADIESRAALLREQTAALDDLSRLMAAGMADGTLTIQPVPHTDTH
ncbi:hypothetical protein [Streptomyces mexicanus]|uniref:DNA methylase adenine-specific domain-containing protein n=1 Tax=Streptomyces mexicanus TaxID=178566 RepID=A0A7X1I546_9ACTN|nr:hypothetical protein [Streptomyces mexicanus]MBC2868892.1 hypothetical protein [Streptomyces mexicanus]